MPANTVKLGKQRVDSDVVFTLRIPREFEEKVENHLVTLLSLLEGFDKSKEFDETSFENMPAGMILKTIRKSNALTQKVFAQMLGIKQTQVSEMEAGVRKIPETVALKVSEKFGLDSKILTK